MANLADGDYYIVNGASTTLYLDVLNGSRRNGANVQVYTKSGTDAQVFQVSTRADGSRQITSRFTGKSIDVDGTKIDTAGTNVQMWTDNDGRAQSWTVTDTGGTISVGGETLPLYSVTLTHSSTTPKMCMELIGNSGFKSGTNVCIAGYAGAADQKWAFVPVPMLQDGGTYQIVLRLDKRYGLDVHSYSRANGANLILAGRHSGNNQKFQLIKRSNNHWVLRNINSGKYIEVSNGRAEDLANVQQWAMTNTAREEWNPVSFGTGTVDGIDCMMVKLYSWVDGSGDTFLMDANQHAKLDLGNICITHTDTDTEGQYSQTFYLVPTRATDPNMAMPTNIGWCEYVGESSWLADRQAQETLYPTWRCTKAWATSGPNHYEWRWRSRLLAIGTSTYGDWSAWTKWQTANVTAEGTQCWVTEGLPATYDKTKSKLISYEIQVRTVGVGETEAVVGEAASGVVRAMDEPTVDLSNAAFGPEGLRIDYTSDYLGGSTTIRVACVYDSSGRDILPTMVSPSFEGLDESSSILIPVKQLKRWINDGESIRVEWYDGNEVINEFPARHSKTLTVAYNAGHSATLQPTVTMGRGRKLRVDVGTADSSKVWIRNADGTIVECKGSGGKFDVPYRFGSDFDLYAAVTSSDGDTWATWHQTFVDGTGLLAQYPPCHAWDWEGGSFLLECDEEPMATDRTFTPEYLALNLDSRRRQTVTFGHTISSEFSAVGLLWDGVTESTKDDLLALISAKHVSYRAPSGEACDVAVTGANYRTHRGYTDVTVNMIEEYR